MRSKRLFGVLVAALVLALAIPVGAAPTGSNGKARPEIDFWLSCCACLRLEILFTVIPVVFA